MLRCFHTRCCSPKILLLHTHTHTHTYTLPCMYTHSCTHFSLSLSPTHTQPQILILSHTHRAWICFLCDERDYGIKEARPRQFSSVWTKAALSSSTMTNTDECLATHWRCAQSLTLRPLYILSSGASDWDSEVAAVVFFFRMTEDQQKHKQLIEIRGRQKNRGELNSKARECWNGSIASEDDLIIRCFCLVFFAIGINGFFCCCCLHDKCCAGWLRVSDCHQQLHCSSVNPHHKHLNQRRLFFSTLCELWNDRLMYSTHQQHNMGIDQLESYGDDVLI